MISISKICGTCLGAMNAINIAKRLANEGKKVYVYKEILHNKTVIDSLEKLGILCIEDLNDVKNGVVVIRAHGEGKATYDYLESHNIEYYDATCKNVIRVHEQINDKYNSNYSIIIIGKKNHPEVIGSNGWCDNTAIIVENEEDIDSIKDLNDNVFIICQTTFSKDKALKFHEKILEKYKNKNIEFVDSICNASMTIQKSAIELAKTSDLMIVIGGKNSSNTKELFNVCSKYCDSYLLSDINELLEFLSNHSEINLDTNIGITAGASTIRSEIEDFKNLIMFYLDYKKIKNRCNIEQQNFNNSIILKDDNNLVEQAIKQLIRLNSDGKFIRAYLISLAYHIFGKNDNDYLPLAISYELFQTAILIHDDIIDNAITRRGKDTIPVYYSNKYSKLEDDIKTNLSNSLAICIGDLGFYLSNQLILDKYSNNPNIVNLLKEYTKIVINTIKGEIIDVELPVINQFYNNDKDLEKDILEIYKLKTSWYTVVGPFRLGMILSGKEDNRLDKILENIGISFQIKDDLLGVFGNVDKIGKSVSSDISEFKQTLLYSYINDYKREYMNELMKYYGNKNLSSEDLQSVKEIFIKSGAKKYAEEKLEELINNTVRELDEIDYIDDKYKDVLKGLIIYLSNREK